MGEMGGTMSLRMGMFFFYALGTFLTFSLSLFFRNDFEMGERRVGKHFFRFFFIVGFWERVSNVPSLFFRMDSVRIKSDLK